MGNLKMATPAEVRRAGWEALRFMLDYEKGEGDYTESRREIFKGKSVEDIFDDMKKEGYV